jgi:hypothetical protein
MLKEYITQQYLRDRYDYNQETGDLLYKYDSGNRKRGTKVGWLGGPGYLMLGIGKKQYYQHHIIWVYMTGEWPTQDIDHINQNSLDNSWSNLRQVSHSANNYNNPASQREDYGVYWNVAKGRWKAQIWEGGKAKHLGYAFNKQQAIAMVQQAISCRT